MPQFDFLIQYVNTLIETAGLSGLSDEQKKKFFPELSARVEERIGLLLLPKLSDAQMERFAELAATEKTTAEEWGAFWRGAIPNFEKELQAILVKIADEARGIVKARE